MVTIEDIYNDIKNGASLKRIHSKYGGLRIYIPQREENYKEKLLADFNGYNYTDLALKYKISENYTREIIREAKKRTPSLFD